MKGFYSVIIAAVLLLTACATIPSQRDIPKPIVEWSEANVWKVLVQGGSVIESNNPTGSSFLIADNTWLTACHVVEDKKVAYVQAADRKHTVLVKVTECNETYDMALLEYVGDDNFETKPIVFAQLGVEDRGKVVYAPGYPLGLPLIITTGYWQSKGDRGNFMSAQGTHGDSGSPALIINDGNVVVVGIRLWGISMLQPITHLGIVSTSNKIIEFLKKNNQTYQRLK